MNNEKGDRKKAASVGRGKGEKRFRTSQVIPQVNKLASQGLALRGWARLGEGG